MTRILPDSWDDEPWPLDDLAPTSFRPVTRSDTYGDPPQVADLADDAQELVDRYGWSMERSLVEAQRRKAATVAFVRSAEVMAEAFQKASDDMHRLLEVLDLTHIKRRLEALTFDVHETDPTFQPRCPRHGALAKGGFCRRCSVNQISNWRSEGP